MRAAVWVLVVVVAGCVESDSVVCGDRTCPVGTECDDVHMLCIDHDQRTACSDVVEGGQCMTAKRAGICTQSVCLPGCSDGVADSGEECDDGNRMPHDGCSATCRAEVPTWTRWQSPWTARAGHMVAYDSDRRRIVVFGGADETGATDDMWERDPDGGWDKIEITRPTPRSYGAMTFDPVRKVTVLFGGSSKFGQLLGDTWEYNGTAWRQITPTLSPTARVYSAMVFDPIRERILLVAGADGVDAPSGGLTNDAWEYDGVTWTKLVTMGTPPPRARHAIAWDTPRQRLVMFGGVRPAASTTVATSETWELAFGASWTWTCTAGETQTSSTCPTAPARPTTRYGTQMIFSPLHNSVLMYGGLTTVNGVTLNASDTWAYGASGWTTTTQVITPPGRNSAALTDSEVQIDATTLAHRPVLIGGSTDQGSIDDVWELTTAWSRTLTPGYAPPRYGISLVYDSKRDRTLSIAGYLPPAPRPDMFAFDGHVWKRLPPMPAIRYAYAALYDSTHDRVGVFGGLTFSNARNNDTYIFNGMMWGQLPANGAPSARYGAAAAHDARTGLNVLFGGNDASGNKGDTWELDANGWTQNTSAGGPPPQEGAAMAFDAARQELVLVDNAGHTWRYIDRAWKQLATTGAPDPVRNSARLVFSPSRKRLVLFGGLADTGTSTTILSDMWELDGDGDTRAWHQVAYSNPPPARTAFGLAAHDALDSLVLHGGSTSAGDTLDDTWLFQWR